MHRRGFIGGMIAALAAPAIVRAEVLMPVRKLFMPPVDVLAAVMAKLDRLDGLMTPYNYMAGRREIEMGHPAVPTRGWV